MTVRITSDRHYPERYKCENFEDCGVSSSLSPEYVGWRKISWARYACSARCAAKVQLKDVISRI